MKRHIYLTIILILVGLFSVLIGFALDGVASMALTTKKAVELFWISKGVSLVLLVLVSLYFVFKKGDVGNTYILTIATVLFQLVPLLLRVVLKGNSPSFLWAAIIAFIAVISYFGLFLMLDMSNDKFKKAQQQLQGKEVDVKDYDNEDGTFKGA